MYKLELHHHFDASHFLKNYEGACARVHGHRWEVYIEIITDHLKNDMVIDFKELKEIINKLDHQNLNVIVEFNPTAENLAKYIYDEITNSHINYMLDLKVTIEESPGAKITYYESIL